MLAVSLPNIAFYPLVNSHCNGISPSLIGNPSSKGPFSIAMLDFRSVLRFLHLTASRFFYTPRCLQWSPVAALLDETASAGHLIHVAKGGPICESWEIPTWKMVLNQK